MKNANPHQSAERSEKKLKKQQTSERQFTDKKRKKEETDKHTIGGF